MGGASTRSLGPEPIREARADTIEATFVQGPQANVVDAITAHGSAALKIHAPPPASNSDNPTARELAADTVTMQFFPDGKNIKHAEAAGKASYDYYAGSSRTTRRQKDNSRSQNGRPVFEEANRVKTFSATDGVRVEIEATIRTITRRE
jgi:hypothetical protein